MVITEHQIKKQKKTHLQNLIQDLEMKDLMKTIKILHKIEDNNKMLQKKKTPFYDIILLISIVIVSCLNYHHTMKIIYNDVLYL